MAAPDFFKLNWRKAGRGLHFSFLNDDFDNCCGEVAEWLNAAVLKTVRGREASRRFKSFLLRLNLKNLKIPCKTFGIVYFINYGKN